MLKSILNQIWNAFPFDKKLFLCQTFGKKNIERGF